MSVEWYCRLMGAEMGPFTAAQLIEMAQSHQLTPEDLVKRGVDGEWVAGYRVKGLFDEATRATAIQASVPPAVSSKPSRETEAKEDVQRDAKPSQDQWFYISAGKKIGPLTFANLVEHSANGRLQATDRVWSSSMPKWSKARKVEGLRFDN